MTPFLEGLSVVGDPWNLCLILIGLLIGTGIGILPGIGATMTTALLLPFTMIMEPVPALALLLSIYCSNAFAGAISAILVNVPGSSSAMVTCLDGYPLAKKGEAGRALGIATVASTLAGIFSVIVFIIGAPLLARMAYEFGPPEYFALTVFGLSMVASISGEGSAKNLIAAAFGLLLATVGIDYVTGMERFTFGYLEMTGGLKVIPILIGLFAITELLRQTHMVDVVVERIAMKAMKLPSWSDYKRIWRATLAGSGIGTFIGILPAEGGTVASLVAYNEVRRWSKNKAEFGHGSIEGLAAAESANNSAVGGAMIPTLALGIPGSSVTAVILVGLTAQGVRPGPYLFNQQPEFIYAIFAIMMVSNIAWLGLGLLGAKFFALLTLVPNALLWPSVFFLAVIGSYSLDQSMLDVWVMLGFGILGYFMTRFGFSVVPLALGIILGDILETSLKRSMLIFEQDATMFLERPIALAFFAFALLGIFAPYFFGWLNRRRDKSLQS
ncbi:tripartite tricarboxylate transporter permease [Roseitranquillus sediminis]|uniref:tripartite tricarboxylate transporter permease n=1 Tax=Roseitranquillus sediminis TaxID=2809051 RepID=UPI001D0C3482|nr:tripartite tricarboxylate transporter permease [Roseitranquillus sediminis]MBM9595480.1 tripartite tricarboxylate transporter permease [Roseitranquillus sediminis]